MRIYSMETLGGTDAEASDSVVLSQKFSHGHRRVRASAMMLGGLALCTPLGLILSNAAGRARLIELGIAEPMIAVQLATVAMIALAALYFGTAELSRPVVRERVIEFDGANAIVDDTVKGRKHRWQAPMSAFKGIRHRVFTTSGGTIHTLLLEHAVPTRSLHIAYETHIANQTIVEAARRYDLPILEPASSTLRKRWGDGFLTWLNNSGGTPSEDRQTAST